MIKTPFWPVPLGHKPIDLGLERINKLMEKLGVTEAKLPPAIHVAGTNGKGSTIAFLRSFIEEAGYSVHVYTSPHLVYFNERIVVAGEIISDDFLNGVLAECKEASKDIPVTFFEGTTAAAFLAFSRVKADILLLETGMGGRLDATNILKKPLLTIITPISFDHMSYLGDTLEKIAGEKAAIIKPGVPCISGSQKPEALKVIERIAKEKNAELYREGHEWRVEKALVVTPSHDGVRKNGCRHEYGMTGFRYISNSLELDLPAPALPGGHQLLNAGAAIAALKKLTDFKMDKNHITAGLKSVKWPGRLQNLTSGKLAALIPPNCSLWLDGGHNREGGEILAEWLKTKKIDSRWSLPRTPIRGGNDGSFEKIYLICGMLKDKETEAFLKNFSGLADGLFAIPIPGEEKSRTPAEIAETGESIGIKSQTSASVTDALREIPGAAPALILICGSLYLAGNVLEENDKK